MTTAPTTVENTLRRRRWLQLAGVLARTAPAALRAPLASVRGRRRIVVRAAAEVLAAAGVRVEVHASPVAWPLSAPGHLVVANRVCWVDDLALLTVVPGVPVAESDRPLGGGPARRAGAVRLDRSRPRTLPAAVGAVAGALRGGTTVTVRPEDPDGARLGRFRPAFLQAAVDTGAPVCPVAVRYRADGGAPAGPLADGPLWRSVARVVGTRGLVVEVHLLPALEPSGTSRRELAVLAEYAVAAVLEGPDRRLATPAGAQRVPRGTSGSGRAQAGSDPAVR
ncbi:lysophospholipid acyltransferase family protein [Modestobacter sp. I12A-02662]|uniref:lysophospholipid acyltransferase family protein n=1 Tax=Modestobacter sp. I12A-02662 TaxID=1730496 RepID=UPI0034DF6C69